MAITSVQQVSGNVQSLSATAQRATIRLLVLSNINNERAAVVLRAGGVPAIGDSLEELTGKAGDAPLVCIEVTADQDASNFKAWTVNATYEAAEFSTEEVKLLPWERKPIIRYPFASSSEPIWVDIDGAVILNAAEVPFDPPIERQFHDPSVVITQFQKNLDYDILVQYQNAVNSDTWAVPGGVGNVSEGQAKVMRIEAEELWHDHDMQYFRVTYEVHMREDKWARKVVEMSMLKKSGNTAPPCYAVITDANGIPLNQPIPIDRDTGEPFTICGATPHTTEFNIYPSKPFTDFIPGPQQG